MFNLLTNIITIRRASAWVVESAVAATTMTIARQPPRAARLEVASSGSGTVYATGLVAGVTTTEAIAPAGAVAQSTKAFTSIAGVTTSGFSGETVSVRAIDRTGAPQTALGVVTSGWPALVDESAPGWGSAGLPGRTQDGMATILIAFSEVFTPRTGDIIDDELGRRWEILGVPRSGGGGIQDPHWNARIRRREGDA